MALTKNVPFRSGRSVKYSGPSKITLWSQQTEPGTFLKLYRTASRFNIYFTLVKYFIVSWIHKFMNFCILLYVLTQNKFILKFKKCCLTRNIEKCPKTWNHILGHIICKYHVRVCVDWVIRDTWNGWWQNYADAVNRFYHQNILLGFAIKWCY